MDSVAVVVATAVAAGAAGSTDAAERAVAEAHQALLSSIARRYPSVDLDPLESSPQSPAARALLAAELERAGAAEDQELLAAARDLLRVIQEQAPRAAAAVGVHLRGVRGGELEISDIESSDSAVIIEETDIAGKIRITASRARPRESEGPPPTAESPAMPGFNFSRVNAHNIYINTPSPLSEDPAIRSRERAGERSRGVGRRHTVTWALVGVVLLFAVGTAGGFGARVWLADGATEENDIEVLDVTEVDDPASNWVLPADVDPTPYLTRPSRNESQSAWMRAHGAVAATSMTWEVTVVAHRASPVEIVNIVPALVEPCGPALVSGYGYMDEHLEGETDKVVLVTDVSSQRPVFDRFGVDDKGDRVDAVDFFATKRISLPKGEKNTIAFTTRAYDGHCRWTYRVEYIADGGRRTMTLTAPGGKPFEMTSGELDKGYDWAVPNASIQCLEAPKPRAQLKLNAEEIRALIAGNGCPSPR